MQKGLFYLNMPAIVLAYFSFTANDNGCNTNSMITDRNTFRKGHITARPNNNTPKDDVATGKQSLRLDTKRDGLIYVPKNYNKEKPAALAVMLHGAGGNAEHGLSLIR